ncbi:MAG: phage head morphogenesis protein [Methanoregula sp.]|jgi:uncharacterized protein with gpF-like domain|nr:phage head morphogenesis protein [Methanoregula sp.]
MAKKPKSSIYPPLDPKVLNALVERNLSFILGLADDTRKNIMGVLIDGITKGLNPRDMISDLVELGFDANRAESIARTETLYAFNTAAKESYRESDIEYVKWLAAPEDGRLCHDTEIPLPDGSICYGGCAEMDGKIFKIDECPDIPCHPRCRCCVSASRGPEDY